LIKKLGIYSSLLNLSDCLQLLVKLPKQSTAKLISAMHTSDVQWSPKVFEHLKITLKK